MAKRLDGLKVAIVVTDGFEQVELTEPRKALEDEGATTEIVSPKPMKVKAWKFTNWGDELPVDKNLADVDPNDYDALLLPGGVMNHDRLRMIPEVQRFVRSFFEDGKPVAAICHGPWTLIDAGVVHGRRMTSWPSLRTDLTNAGADWVDAEVVVHAGLVTSRKPADLPAFSAKIVEELAEERVRGTRPRRGRGVAAPPG